MKKIVTILFSLLTLGLMLSSCSKVSTIKELQGTWQIVEANGFDITNPHATISFNTKAGVAFGKLVCNSFTSNFDTKERGGELELDNLVVTAMASDNQEQELVIQSALDRVEEFEVSKDGESLTLFGDHKAVVLKLTKLSSDIATLQTGNASAEEVDELGGKSPYYDTLPVDSLAGTWEVIALGANREKLSGVLPTITFEIPSGRVSGYLGCNNFTGIVKFDNPKDADYNARKIKFDKVGVTLMACEDMTLEDRMVKILDDTERFGVIEDGMLMLLTADDTSLAILRKKN